MCPLDKQTAIAGHQHECTIYYMLTLGTRTLLQRFDWNTLPQPGISTPYSPKMTGVFEVEVDGVEHDHGLGHHDEPNQVRMSQSQMLTPYKVVVVRRGICPRCCKHELNTHFLLAS